MTPTTANPPTELRPDHAYKLTRKRIYILPTGHGLAFLAVLVVMLLGSINYNNNLGFMLTFLLGSLSLVAILHTYKNLAGLELSVNPGVPVFAGETAKAALQIDNAGYDQRFQIHISYIDPQSESRHLRANVPKDERVALTLPLATRDRGWLSPPRLTVSTRFPLGLLRAWSYYTPARRLLVFPQPAGLRTLPQAASQRQDFGQASGPGNDDFAGLRAYVPGDPSRLIHWKAEAKTETTTVKQFSGASPAEVALSLANCPGANLEAQLSQLALWVVEAERAQVPYSLWLPKREHGSALGTDHYQTCLRDLALFGTSDG